MAEARPQVTETYRAFLLDTLRAQRAELRGIVAFFPAGSVDTALKPGEWTLRQHLHHLREIEMRYLDRLEGVLAHGSYTPPPVDPSAPDAAEPLEAIVEGYDQARGRSTEVLAALDDAGWAAASTIPRSGAR